MILFVCTGNTCRSPMAAVLMREAIRNRQWRPLEIESAGLAASEGEGLSWGARSVLTERGLALEHQAKQITGELGERSQLILTMTGEQKRRLEGLIKEQGKVWTLGELEFLPQAREKLGKVLGFEPKAAGAGEGEDICDPMGGSLGEYRDCLDQIERIFRGL